MRRELSVIENEVLMREAVVRSAVKRYFGKEYFHWVDDAVQDVLCKALENVHQYSPLLGKMDSWLFAMAKNYCFDFMDKKSNNISIRIQCDEVEDILEASAFREEFRFEIKLLRNALKKIQPKDRMLLTLRFYFDYSGPEIAKLTGIPYKQLAVHMQRAKDRLKRRIISESCSGKWK
jgi:RNA polymerase sigma factor (sigma-70 family)